MEIQTTFTCRECGADTTLTTDTSNYGPMDITGQSDNWEVAHVPEGMILNLECQGHSCGHISGQLGLGYLFQDEHRPSHERE